MGKKCYCELDHRLYIDILAFASLVPLGELLLNLRTELKSKTYSCTNTNWRKTTTRAFVLPSKKNKKTVPTTGVQFKAEGNESNRPE